ncbi:MAG: DoxX family protein [Gemmatimonadota bacterium]|jgi:putative oxidoreductase
MTNQRSLKLQTYGLTILRVVVGTVFFAHGAQKLFVWGYGGVVGAFEGMGVPFPAVTAAFAIGAELLGGAALVLGLFTRFATIPLALTMLGALLTVHIGAGFFLPEGYEFVLTLLGASVALTLTGPGALAVDNVLGRTESGSVSGTIQPREEGRAAA